MGLFGFGGKKGGKGREQAGGGYEQTPQGGQGGWESVSQMQFEGQEALARKEAERQQRKIIKGVLAHDPYEGLKTHDVQVSAEERDRYIDGLCFGQVTEADERRFLGDMKDPRMMIGTEQMFQRTVSQDLHQRRILAHMTGAGFGNPNQVFPGSIDHFLEKYPMPMDFDAQAETFLEQIKAGNPEPKYQEYVRDMAKFKKAMYGKRQEYYEQMKALRAEADERTVFLEDARHGGKTPEQVLAEQRQKVFGEQAGGQRPQVETGRERQGFQGEQASSVVLETVSKGEKKNILRRARIDGDPFRADGKEFILTPEALAEGGLSPEHKMNFEGVQIALSPTFLVHGREAAIGYVQTDKGVKVRSYYRSNSQGTWRYLPDYAEGRQGRLGWYGKGYNEESLTLPAEMQMALTQISVQQQRPIETKYAPDFLFAGTAKRYASKDEYRRAMASHSLRGDVYEEVAQHPAIELGAGVLSRRPAEQLDVQGGMAPDFRKQTAGWEAPTGIYGDVQARSYRSENGALSYTFFQDKQGRAWVSGVETTAKVTSTGLRSQWVAGGDITTPLYEYDMAAGGYGDTADRPAGHEEYQGMWKNYLSKSPLIKKFLRRPR